MNAIPTAPEFCSARGRLYSEAAVRPVVLALVRRRWASIAPKGWRERCLARLTDAAWMRFRNGQTPGSLARDLEDCAIFGPGAVKPGPDPARWAKAAGQW